MICSACASFGADTKKGGRAAMMRRTLCLGFLALSLLTLPASALEVGGTLSYEAIYQLEKEELVRSRFALKTSLEEELPVGRFYSSLWGWVDPKDEDHLELDQLYVDIYTPSMDFRIGRQLVSWGTADGFNPTDYVNPKDLFDPLEAEFRKTPLTIAQCTYYTGQGSITGVLVPEFNGQGVPDQMAAFFPEPKEPGDWQDKVQYGLRAEAHLAGYDWQLSLYRGWDPYPALWMVPISQELVLPKSSYRRITKGGLAFAGTVGDVGLWGEGARMWPEKIDELDGNPFALSSNDAYTQGILGVDYTFFDDLYASAQYLWSSRGSALSPYGQDDKAQSYLILQGRYTYWDHELELIGMTNITDNSWVLNPKYSYQVRPAVKLYVGGRFFFGDGDSEFGQAMVKDEDLIKGGIEFSF